MYIDGINAIRASDGSNSYSTGFLLDSGAVANWTATAGSPLSATGSIFIWTSPTTANQTVRISATVGSDTAYRDIFVTGETLSFSPSTAVEGTVDDVTLVHRMENGARRGRRKVAPKQSFDLTFRNRTLTEYNAVLALFDNVGKLEPFGMIHPITNLMTAWYFDSAISQRYGGRGCSIDYSFKVQEA